MKVKKTSSRLVLNKMTVAGLDSQDLRAARGGATGYYCEPTDYSYCTCTITVSTHLGCATETPSICYC